MHLRSKGVGCNVSVQPPKNPKMKFSVQSNLKSECPGSPHQRPSTLSIRDQTERFILRINIVYCHKELRWRSIKVCLSDYFYMRQTFLNKALMAQYKLLYFVASFLFSGGYYVSLFRCQWKFDVKLFMNMSQRTRFNATK